MRFYFKNIIFFLKGLGVFCSINMTYDHEYDLQILITSSWRQSRRLNILEIFIILETSPQRPLWPWPLTSNQSLLSQSGHLHNIWRKSLRNLLAISYEHKRLDADCVKPPPGKQKTIKSTSSKPSCRHLWREEFPTYKSAVSVYSVWSYCWFVPWSRRRLSSWALLFRQFHFLRFYEDLGH